MSPKSRFIISSIITSKYRMFHFRVPTLCLQWDKNARNFLGKHQFLWTSNYLSGSFLKQSITNPQRTMKSALAFVAFLATCQ